MMLKLYNTTNKRQVVAYLQKLLNKKGQVYMSTCTVADALTYFTPPKKVLFSQVPDHHVMESKSIILSIRKIFEEVIELNMTPT